CCIRRPLCSLFFPYTTLFRSETVTGESHGSAVAMLREVLLPVILGRDAGDIDGAHAAMGAAVNGNPSARAAVDIALHDLLGQAGDRKSTRLNFSHVSISYAVF